MWVPFAFALTVALAYLTVKLAAEAFGFRRSRCHGAALSWRWRWPLGWQCSRCGMLHD